MILLIDNYDSFSYNPVSYTHLDVYKRQVQDYLWSQGIERVDSIQLLENSEEEYRYAAALARSYPVEALIMKTPEEPRAFIEKRIPAKRYFYYDHTAESGLWSALTLSLIHI